MVEERFVAVLTAIARGLGAAAATRLAPPAPDALEAELAGQVHALCDHGRHDVRAAVTALQVNAGDWRSASAAS